MKWSTIPTTDSTLRGEYEKILAQVGEITCIAHYSRRAGDKDFRVFDGVDTFEDWLRGIQPSTWIEVFRKPGMRIRGEVDDAFIAYVADQIPETAEFLVAGLFPIVEYGYSCYTFNGSDIREDLFEYLDDARGHRVAVGIWPPASCNRDDVLNLIKPNADGTVTIGMY
jgi:hypothetical protein